MKFPTTSSQIFQSGLEFKKVALKVRANLVKIPKEKNPKSVLGLKIEIQCKRILEVREIST